MDYSKRIDDVIDEYLQVFAKDTNDILTDDMTEQEKCLKEIATELKLIRELLEKTDDKKTVKIAMDVNPKDLTAIVNEVNANKDAVFTF